MAKSFLGHVSFKCVNGVIRLQKGDDYDAATEIAEIVADMIALATQYKLSINVWAPDGENDKKANKQLTPAALAELLEKRNPVICQGAYASYPAPYLAALMPKAPRVAAAKKPAGPDLSRGAAAALKAAPPAAPNLSRKRK